MPPDPASTPPAGPTSRLPALDWMRGLVMVLMAADHADAFFSTGRHLGANGLVLETFADSVRPPPPLDTGPLLTRTATHLCATTFLFLAGAAIALSSAKMIRRGSGQLGISAHIFFRGAVLVALELTVMSWLWSESEGGAGIYFGVLYAIGASMMALSVLRLLPTAGVTLLGAILIVGAEPLINALDGLQLTPSLAQALLLSGGLYFAGGETPPPVAFDTINGNPISILVIYPLASWLGVMCLGFGLGRRIRTGAPMVPWLLFWGLAGGAAAAVLRWWGGIGEMSYPRTDGSWQAWIQASKYPPSVSYLAAALGACCILLSLFWGIAWILHRGNDQPGVLGRSNPLLVLGQVPLFFYLLHLPVLWALMRWVPEDVLPANTMQGTWLAAGMCAAILWPVCALYRRYKQRYGHAWTRYL